MELTFSEEEMRLLLFCVRNRLRYESGRQPHIVATGVDLQVRKIWNLVELREKLEEGIKENKENG